MNPFITINGHPCPYPARGLNLVASTMVDAARNAEGVTVGQKIGRDIQKIDALEWPHLTAAQWSAILKEFDSGFYATVTYPDMVNNAWTTRTMYPGDRTAEVYRLNTTTGLPSEYINCKVNIIDCGEPL